MENIDILIKGLKDYKIEMSEVQKDRFSTFKGLLKEWNEKINLTAIKTDDEIDKKHFLDSLSVVSLGLIKDGDKIIDIGTGGGFPGIPIKIIKDDTDITLLDGLNKRLKFLNIIIEELSLEKIKTVHGRAEDFGKDREYREKYDVAISRAVASLNILCEYCMPFVKKGGIFIAMKGPKGKNELEESLTAIQYLGGEVQDTIDIKIPESDIEHSIIVIKKIKNIKKIYPRSGGQIKKNPL